MIFMQPVPKRSRCLLAACVALSLFSQAQADQVIITPVADAYTRQFSPDLTAGGEPSLVSGCLGDTVNREIRRALIQFDLSGQIPVGATVNSATLRVNVVMVPRARADSVFHVRRVLSQWSEGEVTWNSRLSGVAWQSPGAEGPADASPNPSSSVEILSFGGYDFPSTAGLVADVQAWVDNPAGNFGWMLESEDELTARTARRFGAREDPIQTPALTIDFSMPSLGVVIQPPQQTVPAGSDATFTAVASGTPPFTYQWFFTGNTLPGQTTDVLTLTNVQPNQSGPYTVVASNGSGSVTSAPATLTVTNLPAGVPTVAITSPTNGARFAAPATVTFTADATNGTAAITNVEFFLNGNSVGNDTNAPYTVTVSGLTNGNYAVSAQATDDQGQVGVSPPISFSVVAPPVVSITSPSPGSRFALGTNILIVANVVSNGARITEVDFYAARFVPDLGDYETNLIGTAFGPPYTNRWTPLLAGDYLLSAVAQNELGQTGRSTNVPIRVFISELILPVIALTDAPRNFARITSSPILISGTANDNIGLDRVEYQVVSGPLLQNIGGFTNNASGTTSWSAEVQLVPGKNAVRFRSVDLANNKSHVITRFYTYFVKEPFVIQTSEGGTVVPDLNGRNLQLGKRYTVTAKPAPGYIFAGWENATPTNSRTITFEMTSGLVLVANFVPNPFPAVAGTYLGLFFDADPNRFRPENSGQIGIRLGNRGAFSGKVTLAGTAHGFRGQFDPAGRAQVSILRGARPPIAISLVLDLIEGGSTIDGTVSTTSDANSLTSPLLARRNVFNARTNPAPQAGQRSFVLQQPTDTGVETFASASARISAAGTVSFSGALADSRRFSKSSALGSDGEAPFYLSLNHGHELLIGWLNFGDGSSPAVGGQIFHATPDVPAVVILEAASE